MDQATIDRAINRCIDNFDCVFIAVKDLLEALHYVTTTGEKPLWRENGIGFYFIPYGQKQNAKNIVFVNPEDQCQQPQSNAQAKAVL